MQITTSWMDARFGQFNKEYFGGELSSPKFCINNARTRLGSLSYKCSRTCGTPVCSNYTLRMSNYYDMPEREFHNVLLHEMIHYYIAVKGISDTSSHGRVFRSMMRRLNACGWNITVRANTAGMERAGERDGGKRRYLVLAVITTEGRHLLTVVNPGYARAIDRDMKASRQVKWHAFYTTGDAFFASFPRVRSLRARVVTRQTFEEKINAMDEFKF